MPRRTLRQRKDSESFLAFAVKAADSDLLAIHRVLAEAYVQIACERPEAALDYLLADQHHLTIGNYRDSHSFSKTLISRLAPHLDNAKRRRLEAAINKFDLYTSEQYAEMHAADRFDAKKWTRQSRMHLFKGIPDKLLSEEARILKAQEKTQLPSTDHWDRDPIEPMSFVGPRVTPEELRKHQMTTL